MLKNCDPALTLVALFVVAVYGVSLSSHEPIHDKKISSPDQPATHKIPPESPEDRVADYTEILAWFTAILAIVSSAQIWFLRRADKTARIAANAAEAAAKAAQANAEGLTEANRLARQQIELAHRARVSLLDVTVNRVAPLKRFFLVYTLQNSGEKAATRVDVGYGQTVGAEWAAPGEDDYCVSPAEEEFGLILAPKETIKRRGHVCDFSDSNYNGGFYLRVNIRSPT